MSRFLSSFLNMRKLVFATNNPNKLREIREILSGTGFEILSLQDIGCNDEIAEPFETLNENAHAKAEYIFQKYGLDCFADDTGLEIEALNGRPGVFSARYSGSEANSQKNMAKVLAEMKGVEHRNARFRTVISLILEGKMHEFEGVVQGRISKEQLGTDGFGYDPIFVPDTYKKSFAEMSLEEKNKISHRGKAVEKLVNFLKTL